MKIKLTYTSQMNELKRKLIGMPITFTEVKGKPGVVQVDIKNGYESIFKHALSSCVMTDSLEETFNKTLEEVGYVDSFKKAYLNIHVSRELGKAPWMVSISKKVHSLVEDTLETDAIMDVPMMVKFNLHSEKAMMKQFAVLCDSEVEEEVVEHLASPIFSETYKDLHKDVPKKNITIHVNEQGLEMLVDDGSEVNFDELKDAFFSEGKKQKIYVEDSLKLKEVKDITIIMMMTKVLPIESFVIEDEDLFKRVTYFFNKYDIETKVVAN